VKTSRALAILAVGALGLLSAATPLQADGRRHGGPAVHHSYHHHTYIRPSIGFYWGPSWGWWDPYWYGSGWATYPRVYPNANYGSYGALDTDVSPERAEVWVDGKKVGVADDFDGFPTYLWLPKGTYDVVFYLPGYRTLARQYTIYPGLVIDVEDRLEKGEAVHPLDLGPKSHERRDARIRQDEERRQRVEEQRIQSEAPGAWRQDEGGQSSEGGLPSADARSEPGRLILRVEPGDASVYLDGRFLGTGDDLAALRGGLLVDPGSHTIEVVRPGMESEEETIAVDSGREVELSLQLEEE